MYFSKRFYFIVVGISLMFLGLLMFISDNSQFTKTENLVFNPLTYSFDDYFGENIFLEIETKRILSEMTIEEKAGAVLMPAYEKFNDLDQVGIWLDQYKVGGLMILRSDLGSADTQDILNFYQTLENSHNLPLFLSIDAEPSLMKYRLPSSGFVSETSSLGTVKKSFEAGKEIGEIISSYGVNLNFAPVYDNDDNRSVIGNRSYGSGAPKIVPLAGAFVSGQSEFAVLGTAKHFPGHGSVAGDTHYSLQRVNKDLPEIDQFRGAIEQKIPFMMIGHLSVDGGQYDTNGYPATLSKKISTDLLRSELGYRGIVITDAMNMGALDQFESIEGNLAVTALESGADIVLMPRKIDQAHKLIVDNIKTDPSFEIFINEKIERIIRMKLVWQWTEKNLQKVYFDR